MTFTSQKYKKLLLVGILILAYWFRSSGLNWDQGQHLHPDERFLTMVTESVQWPATFHDYLTTATSPFNPHNRGYGFFVYGTLPIVITKWVADLLQRGDYFGITLVGRALSGGIDVITTGIIFLITFTIARSGKQERQGQDHHSAFVAGLFASFFYACSTLPIQLSHFYGGETYITLWITLAFYLVCLSVQQKKESGFLVSAARVAAIGIIVGCAVASKISSVLFAPIVYLALFIAYFRQKSWFRVLSYLVILTFSLYATVRIAQPYLFADATFFSVSLNEKLIANWKELAQLMKPSSGFPPSIQWFHIIPLVFPLKSIFLWGAGIPYGITILVALAWAMSILLRFGSKTIHDSHWQIAGYWKALREPYYFSLGILMLWILGLFVYQGIQPAPTIRYFHPLYPFLAIVSGLFLSSSLRSYQAVLLKVLPRSAGLLMSLSLALFLFALLIWPWSFSAIYFRPHSRVAASQWIYEHIPTGSTIGVEHWDDGLPLSLSSERNNSLYTFEEMPLYNPDSPEKWETLQKKLDHIDYIVLSSNRLWASLPRVPDIYPTTHRYYEALFDGRLGYQKVAEITSYPTFPLPLPNTCLYVLQPQEYQLGLHTDKPRAPYLGSCSLYQGVTYTGLVLRDDAAEESFTVYDHPKILIFKKTTSIPLRSVIPD